MRRTAMAVVLVCGLVLAGCSSASDDSADGPADTTDGTEATFGQDRIIEGGDPTPGGSVTMGLEAETDGWNPTTNRWATSGVMVALAIYDPLMALDDEGVAQPYLAESITPNDDYTLWTIVLREGVTFHDGTPLTAEAVKATLDGHIASALTRPAMSPINEDGVRVVDDLTLEVQMDTPWVAFPQILIAQVGVIPSLETLTSEDGSRNPVGTGPFDFVEWVPSDRLVTEGYDGYWRTDDQGNPLPYLDGVTFNPIPDGSTRINALTTGQVDVMHTSDPSEIINLEDAAANEEIQIRNDRSTPEKGFVLLNGAQAPFDNPLARRALVEATDAETFNAAVNGGAVRTAQSMFTPESPYHTEESLEVYGGYDPEAAEATVAEYEAETGEPLAFSLLAAPTPGGLETAQVMQQQWEQVGMEVTVESLEQTAYTLGVAQGQFQAVMWRQFGRPDPDTDSHWWVSANVRPIGEIALNGGRIQDEQIDQLLEEGRTNPDPDARIAAYQDLEVRFNELQQFVWINYNRWVVAAANSVRSFWTGTLPDGEAAEPIVSGTFFLTQTWVDR